MDVSGHLGQMIFTFVAQEFDDSDKAGLELDIFS